MIQELYNNLPITHLKNDDKLKKRNIAQQSALTFYIGGNNGSSLVESVLCQLGWSRTYEKTNENFKLRWTESLSAVNFNNLRIGEQLVNHIPNCGLITNKLGLLLSLRDFDRGNAQRLNYAGMFMRDFAPETYIIDSQSERDEFFNVYKKNEIWIYKPTGANQGKGISLIRDIDEFKQELETRDKCVKFSSFGLKPRIVQRYLANPLLLNNRKFDIRAYMLIGSTFPYAVLFHPGYIRLSMNEYHASDSSLVTHLTNQFIQKKDPNYFLNKEDTVWSMERLNDYINEQYMEQKSLCRNWAKIVLEKQMQKIMLHVFNSVKYQLCSRIGFFELYGFDFMIDQDMKTWLIEVNTNPSLHVNCQTLRDILPPMIEEVVLIALECYYKSKKSKQFHPLTSLKNFVPLYLESQNSFRSRFNTSTRLRCWIPPRFPHNPSLNTSLQPLLPGGNASPSKTTSGSGGGPLNSNTQAGGGGSGGGGGGALTNRPGKLNSPLGKSSRSVLLPTIGQSGFFENSLRHYVPTSSSSSAANHHQQQSLTGSTAAAAGAAGGGGAAAVSGEAPISNTTAKHCTGDRQPASSSSSKSNAATQHSNSSSVMNPALAGGACSDSGALALVTDDAEESTRHRRKSAGHHHNNHHHHHHHHHSHHSHHHHHHQQQHMSASPRLSKTPLDTTTTVAGGGTASTLAAGAGRGGGSGGGSAKETGRAHAASASASPTRRGELQHHLQPQSAVSPTSPLLSVSSAQLNASHPRISTSPSLMPATTGAVQPPIISAELPANQAANTAPAGATTITTNNTATTATSSSNNTANQTTIRQRYAHQSSSLTHRSHFREREPAPITLVQVVTKKKSNAPAAASNAASNATANAAGGVGGAGQSGTLNDTATGGAPTVNSNQTSHHRHQQHSHHPQHNSHHHPQHHQKQQTAHQTTASEASKKEQKEQKEQPSQQPINTDSQAHAAPANQNSGGTMAPPKTPKYYSLYQNKRKSQFDKTG